VDGQGVARLGPEQLPRPTGQVVVEDALEAVMSRLRERLANTTADVQVGTKRGLGLLLRHRRGPLRWVRSLRAGLRGSLRWRLTLAMLLVFALGLAVSAVLSTREVRQEAARSADEALQEEAMDLREDARQGLVWVFVEEARDWLLVFVPLAMASFALVWLIGRWSLRPLARASREAAAIGPANPSGRVSVEALPREVRPLVDAVNGALERLDHAYAAQRRFTADAAHELRTPLAVLGLRLQRAKLAAADRPAVERDLAQMNRLVGQLLDLARLEDPARLGEPTGIRPVDLARVAREAAAMVLPLAEEKGRPLEVEAAAVVSLPGRPDELRRALCNLLENALVHGGGAVRVRVRVEPGGSAGRRAVVEVSDEGPGIAEGLREEVFDRFRKAAPGEAGAGLGLAIVRQVARAHGGEARVRPGPGCRVEIALPVPG
jgi:signal transduction histidine kinase